MYVAQPAPTTCAVLQSGVMAGSQQQPLADPVLAKFSTTQTFTTTHGFVISTAPAAPSASSSSSGRSGASGGSSSSTSSSGSSGSRCTGSTGSCRSSAPQGAERQPSTPVGWSGLLEISRAAGTPGVVGVAPAGDEGSEGQGHIEVACTAHTTPGVRRLVKSVIRGLKARQEPEAAREGMGGTYFFPNEGGGKCAIFKPCDEEPLAPANPKGFVGRALGDPGWKSTVRVGEAAMREVAAYLLDHDHFAQVPHTVLVQAQHPIFNYCYAPAGGGAGAGAGALGGGLRAASASSMASLEPTAGGGGRRPLKLGSLQEFVQHVADTNEMGSSRFRRRDVHAIGILDLRLFNTDRHAGNILVREPPTSGSARDLAGCRGGAAAAAVVAGSAYELVPIDHGFCLPEALEAPYFEWLHWPQACLPFDEEELAYIARLDAAADVALLERELPNLRPECLRVLEVATTLLQRCAAAGLSLADIGALASRPLDALDGDDSCPSELEKACVAARQAVETRELAAMLTSSSCGSSSDGSFALREEDEDGFDEDCSSEADDEALADAPHVQQQQQRPRSPSRLAAMAPAAADADAPPAAAPAGGGPPGSGDLASVMSEGTVFNLATAMSLGSSDPRRAATGDGDLLFDLDDDCGSGSPATTPGSGGGAPKAHGGGDVAMPQAAPAAGGSAEGMMDAEALGDFLAGSRLLQAAGAAGAPGAAGAAPPSPGLPPLARSVHVGDGWMRGGLKGKGSGGVLGRVAASKKPPGAGGLARRRAGVQRVMYPPPVVRAAPRATNEVLGGLGDAQWAQFMRELCAYMDAALRPSTGSWRRASAAAGLGAAAMSCPRF